MHHNLIDKSIQFNVLVDACHAIKSPAFMSMPQRSKLWRGLRVGPISKNARCLKGHIRSIVYCTRVFTLSNILSKQIFCPRMSADPRWNSFRMLWVPNGACLCGCKFWVVGSGWHTMIPPVLVCNLGGFEKILSVSSRQKKGYQNNLANLAKNLSNKEIATIRPSFSFFFSSSFFFLAFLRLIPFQCLAGGLDLAPNGLVIYARD